MSKITGKSHIDIIDFLHEGNHQGKVASKTASLRQMWPSVPLVQSDSGFLIISIWKESIDTLTFSEHCCSNCKFQVYLGWQKAGRGDLTVLKFASAAHQHYFFHGQWDFMLRRSGFTSTTLANQVKIFSSRKLFSESSLITNFFFYLTFVIKYCFYYMRSCHLGCILYCYRLYAIKAYKYL